MVKYLSQYKIALRLLLIITVITGIIYPLVVTILAQLFFPFRSNGSLIIKDQKIIGSELIGQFYEDPKYFWGRPSATANFPYNALYSGGSNLGPLNKQLLKDIEARIVILKKFSPKDQLIPIDLVTASASGLDPHISVNAALYQVNRISKTRNLPKNVIINLINKFIEKPQFGFLGEAKINVLKLNIALDEVHL